MSLARHLVFVSIVPSVYEHAITLDEEVFYRSFRGSSAPTQYLLLDEILLDGSLDGVTDTIPAGKSIAIEKVILSKINRLPESLHPTIRYDVCPLSFVLSFFLCLLGRKARRSLFVVKNAGYSSSKLTAFTGFSVPDPTPAV
jgi:hypothetical protein